MNTFAGLVLSLPTRDSTVRMRVWRALKGSGCGVLRDGVYLLPRDAPTLPVFPDVETQVRSAGGFAMAVDVDFRTPKALDHARGLFDRSKEYGELVGQARAAKGGLAKLGKRKAETLSRRVRESFDQLATLDFFPGEAKRQAEAAVLALQGEVERLHAAGEPRSARGKVRRASRDEYRGRVWATRKDLWVDRLASAWLIKRFIDKDARFKWLDAPRDCPKTAVGFDFDGARFTHVGSRVTFEVLLASFGLEADAALVSIGAAVHFLDAGGIPVADARGLETVLRGIKARERNDDERASKAFGVFDNVYAAYSSK
jgi:hypothetical protein